ncbi:hypothetical protein BU17DRAFT_100938 [Hysterangium stoloniferum]|nr:hypothetical protein BU17DRAFT_100938 [Hysterangium stoloniferum]
MIYCYDIIEDCRFRTALSNKSPKTPKTQALSTRQEHRSGSFHKLVDDVMRRILLELDTTDYLALTLVSRRSSALATPFLYREIKLLLTPVGNSITVADKQPLRKSQARLRKTLTTHPSLYLHIQSFGWSLGHKESLLPLMHCVAAMSNLRRIELVKPYNGEEIEPREDFLKFVRILPKCRQVLLEGNIPAEAARSLIHPAQLRELSLDGMPSLTIPLLRRLSSGGQLEFSNLTSITLRFPGGYMMHGPGIINILTVWKGVLLSLRNVVEDITLGTRMTRKGIAEEWNMVSQPPKDDFLRVVLPIFISHSFPRLVSLILEGFPNLITVDTSDPWYACIEAIFITVPSLMITSPPKPSEHLWKWAYNNKANDMWGFM